MLVRNKAIVMNQRSSDFNDDLLTMKFTFIWQQWSKQFKEGEYKDLKFSENK